MNTLRTIIGELLGLVVDDVAFAVAVTSWIVLVWLLSASALPASPWTPVLLFAGLVAILLESTFRRAGKVR